MSRGELRVRFLDGQKGRILCVLHKPDRPRGPAVLVVAPFAEEMNKVRKMLTQVAKELDLRGVGMVIADYYGTGDSDGDFAEVDWDTCKQDLAVARSWSESEGWPVRMMLSVRLGCILGCEMAQEHNLELERTVFWQPVLSGTRWLDQFLRLRVAASMMEGDSKETVAALRARLGSGEPIEVAGYEISGTLAQQLDRRQLQATIGSHLGEVHWMEVVRSAGAELPKPSSAAIEAARAAGRTVTAHPIVGEPYWSSTEIVCIPDLVQRTVLALSDAHA